VLLALAKQLTGSTIGAWFGRASSYWPESIYPREIEDLLFAHPAVEQAAVVGIPDEQWGEVVAAFVQLASGQQTTADELRSYCRDHLAPYKTPARFEFVDAFPTTPSGKIQKFKLAEVSRVPR
jgi:fatty-acyl-CoA synthase